MSVIAAANPDVRPLPPNWTEHFDQRRGIWYYMRNDCDPPRKSYVHPLGPPTSNNTSPHTNGNTRTMTFAQKLYASSFSSMSTTPTTPDVQPDQSNRIAAPQNLSNITAERPFIHPPPPPPLNLPPPPPPVVVPSPPQRVSPSLQSPSLSVPDANWNNEGGHEETILAYLQGQPESPIEESHDRWSSLYREEEEFERQFNDSGVSLQRSPTYVSIAPRQSSLPSYPGPEPAEIGDQLSSTEYYVPEDRVLQTDGPLPARAPSYSAISVSPSSPMHRSGPRSVRRISGPRSPSSPIAISPPQIKTSGAKETEHPPHRQIATSSSNDSGSTTSTVSPSISPLTPPQPIESPAMSHSISSDTTSLPPSASPPFNRRFLPSQINYQHGITVPAQETFLGTTRQRSPQETRLSPKRPVMELYTYASAPAVPSAAVPSPAASPQSSLSTQSRSPTQLAGQTRPILPHSSTASTSLGTSISVDGSNVTILPPPGRTEQQPHRKTFSSVGGNNNGINNNSNARPLPHRASAPPVPPSRSMIHPNSFEQTRLPTGGFSGGQPRLAMNTTILPSTPSNSTSQIRSPVIDIPPPLPQKLPPQPPQRSTRTSVPTVQPSPSQTPPSFTHIPSAPPQAPSLPPRQVQQFYPYAPQPPPQKPQNQRGWFGSSSNSHLIRNGLIGGVAGLAGAAILNEVVTGSPTVDGGTIANLVSGMSNLMSNANSDNGTGPDFSSYTTDNLSNVDPSSYAYDPSAFGNPSSADSSSTFDPSFSDPNVYQQYDQQQPFVDSSSYQQYDPTQQQQPLQTQVDSFQQQSEDEMKIFSHQLELQQKEEEAIFKLQQQQMLNMENVAQQQQATILQQQQQIQQLNQQLPVNPQVGATAGVAAAGGLGVASHVVQSYPQTQPQGNQPLRPFIQTANLTLNTGGPSSYAHPSSIQHQHQTQLSYNNNAGMSNVNLNSQHSVGHTHNAYHNAFTHSIPHAAGPSAMHQQQMYHHPGVMHQQTQHSGGLSGLISKIPPSVSSEVGKLAVTGAVKLLGNAMSGFNNNN